MASASIFARTVARHSFTKVLRVKSPALIQNVRFASTYFTPGEIEKQRGRHRGIFRQRPYYFSIAFVITMVPGLHDGL